MYALNTVKFYQSGYEPTIRRGSATDNQLAYIESLAHGFAEDISEARFGRSLLELSVAEASQLIDYLIDLD